MTFYKFIASKSDDELTEYAKRCNTTIAYLKNQLKNAYKVPRGPLLNALWMQSDGQLSREDVMNHFFPTPEEVQDVG